MSRRRFLFLTPLFLAACGREGDPVLARVDSSSITAENFDQELASTPFGRGPYLQTAPGKKEFLDLLIRRQVILNEAHQSPVADRPETRKKLAELDREFLRQRQEQREQLVVSEFLRDLQEGPLKVSDEDVKTAWSQEVEAKASHILVSDETKARELRAVLDKGGSFEALAKEYSEDPTGQKRGGDMGYLMRGSLDQALETAIFALKMNEVGGPVASPYGFHLIKRTGERPLSGRPLPDQEEAIRNALTKRKFLSWISDAKKRHSITINSDAIEKAGPPASTTPR